MLFNLLSDEVANARKGNDRIFGEGCNDTLTSGLGADRLNGSSGTYSAADFPPIQGDTQTGVEIF